jgi:NADH:ubiquinone oxidoreductase subunit H
LVRQPTHVAVHRRGLRSAARLLGLLALAYGFALLPVLSGVGRGDGAAPVLIDLEHGLVAVMWVLVVQSFARTIHGLADRSPWARLGAAGQSGRAIASAALLAIVLAPLALDAGSLRLHAIVADQARPFELLIHALNRAEPGWGAALARLSPPAWNLFVQPLTALLFLPAISLWTASPRVDDPTTGSIALVGDGLDADPADLYWMRLESRAAAVFAAGLFVTLFLGADGIPFFEASRFTARLEPFVGVGVPAALVTLLCLVSFLTKLLITLGLTSRLARSLARAQDARRLELSPRRLVPLAWANLLLVAAVTLWAQRWLSGGGG